MKRSFHISAVVPTYNREKTIEKAINSILAQKWLPWEILVIDDGSTDKTRQSVEKYGQTVRYIYQRNGGVSAARNRGVKEANGEWVAFLDSDDYWDREHLARMVSAMEATEGEACLYFSDVRLPADQGGGLYWKTCGFTIRGEWELAMNPTEWGLMKIQPMMLQASVVKRRSYVEVGGLPEHMATREDTLLFHKLCMLGAVCAVAGCGTVMTANGGEGTRLTERYDSKTEVFWDCTRLLYEEMLKSSDKMSKGERNEFTGRLVRSYLALGRLHLRRRQVLAMFSDVASAAFVSPKLCVKNVTGMVGGYIAGRDRK